MLLTTGYKDAKRFYLSVVVLRKWFLVKFFRRLMVGLFKKNICPKMSRLRYKNVNVLVYVCVSRVTAFCNTSQYSGDGELVTTKN